MSAAAKASPGLAPVGKLRLPYYRGHAEGVGA